MLVVPAIPVQPDAVAVTSMVNGLGAPTGILIENELPVPPVPEIGVQLYVVPATGEFTVNVTILPTQAAVELGVTAGGPGAPALGIVKF